MIKLLEVKNTKQLNNFYKLLPIYKSFIYRPVEFIVEDDKFKIQKIVYALNIKSRRKRISYVFDEACREIDELFKEKNICGFKNGKCYLQRKNHSPEFNGCCRKCRYQSCEGCITKNLACKLFFCSEVKKRHKVIEFDDIKILRCLSIRQRLIVKSDYFSKRDEVLKDLYFNSICIATIRMIWRLKRNLGKHKI